MTGSRSAPLQTDARLSDRSRRNCSMRSASARLWPGNDGFEGVIRQKLTELGVPEKPIPLAGPGSMTPRQIAEESGFIKRPRPARRLKAK